MLLKHKAWCARGIRGLRKIPRYSFLGNPSSQNFPSKSRLEKTSNFFFLAVYCLNSAQTVLEQEYHSAFQVNKNKT